MPYAVFGFIYIPQIYPSLVIIVQHKNTLRNYNYTVGDQNSLKCGKNVFNMIFIMFESLRMGIMEFSKLFINF